jgi:hypothetical protein
MPRWDTANLIDPPRFTLRNWFAMLGPGLLMGGAAIGGGEWLTGPLVTARYGGALLWLATLSILGQVVYNLEICRYTLYTGEPIFTGKFRTLPGPMFWLVIYVMLDFGSVFPYLAASAATPVAAIYLGYIPNKADPQFLFGTDWFTDIRLLTALGYAIFLLCLIPLIFGGKVYNSLKVIMSFKIVTVFTFLLILGIFFSSWGTWAEIFSGFVKFGNVPVLRDEDRNGNGILDPGEDWDGDGKLDTIEWFDTDGDGRPETWEDLDGDGIADGDGIENVFVSLWRGEGFPTVNLAMIATLCAMIAISGQGGLSNTPLSNYTRDQGWGMGYHVGAIPSVVGGHNLQLSHVGSVFQVTSESLVRWKRWYRHVMRDQLVIWMPACFIGLALPSMLSVAFLRRGTVADTWTAAGMTADGVRARVTEQAGSSGLGHFFWFMTLFCGFLVLAPSMASSADGVIRRWVDVFWTASPMLRRLDPRKIKVVYFSVLCGYAVFGLLVLMFVEPGNLILISTNIFNWALGFSCFHALAVNLILLPRELRPGWFVRIALTLAGVFFSTVAALTSYEALRKTEWFNPPAKAAADSKSLLAPQPRLQKLVGRHSCLGRKAVPGLGINGLQAVTSLVQFIDRPRGVHHVAHAADVEVVVAGGGASQKRPRGKAGHDLAKVKRQPVGVVVEIAGDPRHVSRPRPTGHVVLVHGREATA